MGKNDSEIILEELYYYLIVGDATNTEKVFAKEETK